MNFIFTIITFYAHLEILLNIKIFDSKMAKKTNEWVFCIVGIPDHFETLISRSFQSFNQVTLEKFQSQVSQFAHNFQGEFFDGLNEFYQVHLDAGSLAQIDKLDFIAKSSKS